MLAVTYSVAPIGVQAAVITIEVNSGKRGELRYILVGLPDSAVKESQDRVLRPSLFFKDRFPNRFQLILSRG